MIDFLRTKVKHYDRSVVLIGTALSVLFAIYLGTQNSVNRIIETSEVVHSLKLINAQQAVLNAQFTNELGELKSGQVEIATTVRKVLFELRRR